MVDSAAPPDARLGTILGGCAMQSADGATAFRLAAMSLDRPDPRPVTVPVTFLPHGVTPSPVNPDLLLLFEKHGPGCCAVTARTDPTITANVNVSVVRLIVVSFFDEGGGRLLRSARRAEYVFVRRVREVRFPSRSLPLPHEVEVGRFHVHAAKPLVVCPGLVAVERDRVEQFLERPARADSG